MLAATDIETYVRYDGSKKSYDFIRDNQKDPQKWKKKQKDLHAGNWYPVLNSRCYALGILKSEEWEREKVFTDPKTHWEAIKELGESQKRRGKKLYLYGHHHRYDFFGYAADALFDERMKIILEDPLFAIWDDTIYFLDTKSFYPMSLDELGTLLNCSKGKMPETVRDPQELATYCAQDVTVTLCAMQTLKESLASIGYFPKKMVTAGQLAMSTFQTYARKNNLHHIFMHSGEVYRSDHVERLRYALRGARCQAFQKGRFKKATVLDINRMYVYAMVHMDFPDLRDPLVVEKPKYSDWTLIKDCEGVVEATIEIDTKELPYLMAYTKLPGKRRPVTVFPKRGKVRGHWTIFEVRRALELPGYKLVSLHWAEVYKKARINPFREYLLNLFALGQSDPKMKATSKILGNNLYGKWGQRRQHKETLCVHRADAHDKQREGFDIIGYIDDRAILEKHTGAYVASYTNPYISARITAQARDYHYDLLRRIPKEDLLYCDTDSIVYKGEHAAKYTIGTGLGELKVEHEGPVLIKGRKRWFPIGGKAKVAGVPKRDMTEQEFEAKSVSIRRMIGLSEGIALGDTRHIGTFKNIEFDLTGEDIDSIPIPAYIDERDHYDAR